MPAAVDVRKGAYYDSVTLMRVSRDVAAGEGVEAALVAMATELNLQLLAGMGFDRPAAGPGDLVVAIRAADDAALAGARSAAEAALAGSSGGGGPAAVQAGQARTLRTAAAGAGANLALVSVPGRYAFAEAMEALEAGLHVMVFSDNVPLEQEIALKDAAAARGLLVMGPDCGTALVGGVGLGFANAVRPGPVGIVAASGTGAQQVMCLLDHAGVGISHVLGVGGRDLSAGVAARSTLRAMAMLGDDPATEVVVVVSKPAPPEVRERVEAACATLGKPVVTAILREDTSDLASAAGEAARLAGVSRAGWPSLAPADAGAPRRGALRGLFSGGTLCDEAMVIAAPALGPIRSNIPLDPQWALPEDLSGDGHLMIDFGDDRLTVGRPHPMIDPSLRLDRLAREAADPEVSVVLLDVVLGYAAHPDPAADLAPAINAARQRAAEEGRELAVVLSLCGTAGDPQDFDRQATALQQSGAWVFASNAEAARHAAGLAAGPDGGLR